MAAVRIEALARSLGVTKGSFYWHFRDRRALHEAMLGAWRERVVSGPIDRLREIAKPLDRYRAMLRLPFRPDRPDFDMEFGVRLWARNDDLARDHLRKADAERLDFIEEVMVAAGAAPATARARAVLAFAYIRVGGEVSDEATVEQFEALLVGD